MSVPVVDLRSAQPGEIDRICRELGFLVIRGHGVAPAVIEAAHQAATAFFDLPLADRMEVAVPRPGYPYGYIPMATEALNRSLGGDAPPDLKETYSIGPVGPPPRPLAEMDDPDERAVYAPNLWPAALPALQPAMTAYYEAMARLAVRLMRLFALALDLPERYFDRFVDRHGSALRLAHYPARIGTDAAGSALRAGTHTDYGTLTILLVDDQPGLEVAAGDGWLAVAAEPGDLIVNLGDLMQRWTNDRWVSTMHRVVVPAGPTPRRLSIPFFHNANWDASIECLTAPGESPRHAPTTAGAHLMSKFRATVM